MELLQNQLNEPERSNEYFRVKEVAYIFNVSSQTVGQWIKDGTLPALKLPGRRGRYRISRVDAFEFAQRFEVGRSAEVSEDSTLDSADNQPPLPLFGEEGGV